jgi:hypothetical protein
MKNKMHHAVLALVAGWLQLMPPPLRAAESSIAVPGTADVQTGQLGAPAATEPPSGCPYTARRDSVSDGPFGSVLSMDEDQNLSYREGVP